MNETTTISQPRMISSTPTMALSTEASQFGMKEPLAHTAIFLIALYVIIFLLGVGGNTTVIVFFTRKANRTLYDTYIIHLAIADLLMSLVTPPRAISTIVVHDEGAFLDEVGCRALSAIEPISVNASSWILTSIAIERYRGIVQPFKSRYRRCNIHIAVSLIWLISLAYFIPYICSITVVGKHCAPRWDTPQKQFAFNAVVLFIQSVIPIVIMCYTLLSVCQVMRKRQKANLGKSLRGHAKNANLIVVLLAAFIVFTLCTLPYNIFYLVIVYDVGIMGRNEKLGQYTNLNYWLATMVLVSSITNCCIYAGLHKEFKKFCIQCIQRGRSERKGASSNVLLTLSSKKKRRSSSYPTTNGSALLK